MERLDKVNGSVARHEERLQTMNQNLTKHTAWEEGRQEQRADTFKRLPPLFSEIFKIALTVILMLIHAAEILEYVK